MAKVKPIKIAVVGLGRAGWNIHVNRMRGHDEFQIMAVADYEESRRNEAKEEFGCETYHDYKSLLKSADAELVVVATQSHTHAPITCAALKSGRHVIVEKPMAMNVAEANRMIKTSEATGKKLFVHQNYRYATDFKHLREILKSGLIGKLFEVRIRVLHFTRRNDWQTLQKYGGGVLNNTGPHFIDSALQLLEAPVSDVFCDLQLISDAGDTEDHVKLLIRAENGRVADIEISTSCAFTEPKWTLLGTHGTLISNGKTSQIRYYDPKKVKKLRVIETPPEGRRYGNEDKLPWEEKEMPSVSEDKSDFYDNVVAVLRRRAKMEITPESVREVIRVIQMARKNSKFYR